MICEVNFLSMQSYLKIIENVLVITLKWSKVKFNELWVETDQFAQFGHFHNNIIYKKF